MKEHAKKADVNIKEIIVKNDDGTERVITKGFVGTLEEKGDQAALNMQFANMSGEELNNTLYALLSFAEQVYEGREGDDPEDTEE